MNQSPAKRPRLAMSLLEEHYYCAARRRPVVCRLWRMYSRPLTAVHAVAYSVGLESFTKRYLYYVGTDESSARALVRRIARNKLDPIHLSDVIADYIWEAESFVKIQETESE